MAIRFPLTCSLKPACAVKTHFFPVGERNGSSTLPHCHLWACSATARKWRGCGKSKLPFSAAGSGSLLFPKKGDQRKCPLDSTRRWGIYGQNQGRRYRSGACPGRSAYR